MSSENPFKILKISPNSGVDEIKQAFRSLILSAHPDVNHESGSNAATEKLIRAYHNALSEAKKKQQPNKDKIDFSLFELQYEFFFGKSFSFPKTKQDFFRHLVQLLQNIRKIFYSKSDFSFIHTYLMVLIKRLNTNETPTWYPEQKAPRARRLGDRALRDLSHQDGTEIFYPILRPSRRHPHAGGYA